MARTAVGLACSQEVSAPISLKPADLTSEAYAHELDDSDLLAEIRDRFCIPPNTVYLDGSLPISWDVGGKAINLDRSSHLLR